MLSIIIPTRNRAYTLEKVLDSYYSQDHLKELILINDASLDSTEKLVKKLSQSYPHIKTIIHTNEKKMGASFSRNKGIQYATCPFVLIGEDDAYLEKNYAKVLIDKLISNPNIGIASGRLIDLLPSEDPQQAIDRFGYGDLSKKKPFDIWKFGHVPNAYYDQDIFLPLTHALIVTHRHLVERFPYDSSFAKGNGFREESDFQIQVFLNDFSILVSNETHALHMHPKDVNQGGHRVSMPKKIFYNIYYTHRFYKKYYKQIQEKLSLPYPRFCAMILFSFSQFKELTVAITKACYKRVLKYGRMGNL